MRLDLTDLRLFLAVVDAGSITHGAAAAGLSLAAASERLRGMEEDGSIRLLERGRRGVTPTEAGEALVHHARLILRQVTQMRGELGEHARTLRTTVRVAANTAAIVEFLPQRLAPWLAHNPRIDIDLKERQSEDIAKAVASGFAEIGILSDAVAANGLHLFPFAVDRLVLVAHRDHPIARQERVGLADVMDQHFIGLADGALQAHIEARAAELGGKLRMRMRVRTFESICRMASHGAGIGIVPQTAAQRCRRFEGIASIGLGDAWATRRLVLCIRAGEELTPPARSLLAHLTATTANGSN